MRRASWSPDIGDSGGPSPKRGEGPTTDTRPQNRSQCGQLQGNLQRSWCPAPRRGETFVEPHTHTNTHATPKTSRTTPRAMSRSGPPGPLARPADVHLRHVNTRELASEARIVKNALHVLLGQFTRQVAKHQGALLLLLLLLGAANGASADLRACARANLRACASMCLCACVHVHVRESMRACVVCRIDSDLCARQLIPQ